jgi:hypothetical protein
VRPGWRLVAPGGDPLRVVAYQVPLKAARFDPVGKVDGVALLGDGRCCLVELKAPTVGATLRFERCLRSFPMPR